MRGHVDGSHHQETFRAVGIILQHGSGVSLAVGLAEAQVDVKVGVKGCLGDLLAYLHLAGTGIGEVLHRAGNGGKPMEALRQAGILQTAVFNVSKGNVHSLEHPAHAEQAALGVRITGAVGQEGIVLGTPQQYGFAHGSGDHARHLFVAEVAGNQPHRVHLFPLEAVNDRVHVLLVVQDIHIVDTVQIDKGDMRIRKVLFNIRHCFCTTLLRFFPVEDTGAGGYVSADGNQTDFYRILKHTAIPPKHNQIR